jgi:biofilm PGA synthesis N-glycosyltransferase PgaC
MIVFICLVSGVFIFYFIFILRSSIFLAKTKTNLPQPSIEDTEVSVVVPFRNEVKNLPALIQSFSALEYSRGKLEFILIDDHSKDGSYQLVSGLIKTRKNFKLLKSEGKPGKKNALYFGIKNSLFENIIITDADCVHQKYWLRFMIPLLAEKDMLLVFGGVRINAQSTLFARFQALEFLSLVGVGAASFMSGNPIMCNAANLAFKKALFLEAFSYLHPAHPSGDDIFLLSFTRKNYPQKIAYCPNKEAIVTTNPVSGIWKFFSQRMRWASKSVYYDDFNMILLALLVFLSSLFSILLPVFSFANAQYFSIFLILISLKAVIDYTFLRIAALKTGQEKLLRLFIFSSLVHPFYIMISAFGGFFVNFMRKLNRHE